MIKVLSLCAALLAPESTGLDPHGRALHLKLYADFNTSYEACITTVKQSRKYGVDPFVMVAIMYDTTAMAPTRTKRTHAIKRMLKMHGCDRQGQFIRSSCSAYMLAAPYFASLLSRTTQQDNHQSRRSANYQKATCLFYSGGDSCKPKHRKKAQIIENVARRYADVYSRTHTSFRWKSPFPSSPSEEDTSDDQFVDISPRRNQYHDYNNAYRDPLLDDLLLQLGMPPMRYSPEREQAIMQQGISVITLILGNDIHIEANSGLHSGHGKRIKYFLFMNYGDLKNRMAHLRGFRSGDVHVVGVNEFQNGHFVINVRAQSSKLVLKFYQRNDNSYEIFIN